MSNLQGKHKVKKMSSLDESGVKCGSKRRRKAAAAETVSADTPAPPPGDGSITKINFDEDISISGTMDIKVEPGLMDEDPSDDAVLVGPSTANIDASGLKEEMVYYSEVKTEVQDDPLMVDGSASVQHEVPLTVPQKPCDEGFMPAHSHSLPRVGSLAVADFLTAARRHHERETLLAVTKQPIEDLNDSVGFVQVRREDNKCTVKCTVASRTVEHACSLTYDEEEDAVLDCTCECRQLNCLHVLAALVWLHSKMECPVDMSFWCEPMIRMPKAMTLKQIFGIPERPPEIDNSVLEKFLMMCQESNNYSPGIMRYYCEDERTKCSLHKLGCKYSELREDGAANAGGFLEFCRNHITSEDCNTAERETLNSVEVKREILYGRITEATAHEITKHATCDVHDIVDSILCPDDEIVADKIPDGVIGVLEKTMNTKITKCGTLIDRMSPIFAASPYGTTPTHTVQIRKLDCGTPIDKDRKLSMMETTAAQMQMYFAKKELGYLCVYKDQYLDVKVVKLNKVYCASLVEKCSEFWKNYVFKRIIMED